MIDPWESSLHCGFKFKMFGAAQIPFILISLTSTLVDAAFSLSVVDLFMGSVPTWQLGLYQIETTL